MHYYIHIPFCRQRCTYCKFALTPHINKGKKRHYLARLVHEMRSYFEHTSLPGSTSNERHTIYFGGGTPSVLDLSEIAEILEVFPFDIFGGHEVSFEANPEDITPEYAQ